MLGFINQFYDVLESRDKLDHFINNFGNQDHSKLGELIPILRDSTPATSTVLAHCLQTLLTQLYHEKPPNDGQGPVELGGIVTIYQTARLFYACLNYSFSHPEKQQQCYIEQQFKHQVKESLDNPLDNLAGFEYVVKVLLTHNVQFILSDLDPDYYQRVVDNIHGLSKGIRQAYNKDDLFTGDLLQIYKSLFQWIDYTVQLRQAYQKQDSDLIQSHKENLTNIISAIERQLCDWGLDDQAESLQAKFLLNGQAGQQVLLFFIYCDQKHSHGLFRSSLSQGIAQHLYRAASSDHLKTIVNFIYFKRNHTPLNEVDNHLINFHQNAPYLAQRNDGVRQIIQSFERVVGVRDDCAPLYVLKDVQACLIILNSSNFNN